MNIALGIRKGIILTHNGCDQVLLIEGRRGNNTPFASELEKKGYKLTLAESGRAGLALLAKVDPDIIIINAASLRTNGVRICHNFRSQRSDTPIILIVAEDTHLKWFTDASVILNLPFTIQKLLNRIHIYHPSEDKYLLNVGPITLNLQTNFASCNGNETHLTPRLSQLLRYLMERPGQVINRGVIFKKVWDTDYLGDTRSLDVHISWLRKAIEEDPHKPKLIRTIRAAGYKLDI